MLIRIIRPPVAMLLTCSGVMIGATAPAAAQAAPGVECSAFKWSVDQERQWFSGSDLAQVKSGATIAGEAEQAFALELINHATVKFALPPEREPKAETPYSGTVTVTGNATEGRFQITLSDRSWVDVVANGQIIPSTSSAMDLTCATARKSVRYDLPKGPITLQISGVPSKTIKIAIRRVRP